MITNYPMRQDFEVLAFKLKFLKTNWLIIVTFKPPTQRDITFTSEISWYFIAQLMEISNLWVILT